MMVHSISYCRCEAPVMDVFHDAGCRRCGLPVDFAGKPPRTLSCGCCTEGCVCGNHCDVPRGIRVGRCDYHRAVGHPMMTSPSDDLDEDAEVLRRARARGIDL